MIKEVAQARLESVLSEELAHELFWAITAPVLLLEVAYYMVLAVLFWGSESGADAIVSMLLGGLAMSKMLIGEYRFNNRLLEAELDVERSQD